MNLSNCLDNSLHFPCVNEDSELPAFCLESCVPKEFNLSDEQSDILLSCQYITPGKYEKINTSYQRKTHSTMPEFSLSYGSGCGKVISISPINNFDSISTRVDDNQSIKVVSDLDFTVENDTEAGSLDLLRMILKKKNLENNLDLPFSQHLADMIPTIEYIENLTTDERRRAFSAPETVNTAMQIEEPEKMEAEEVEEEQDKPKHTCKCSKSKCLKLYCECFAAGGMCGKSCRCTECLNSEGFADIKKIVVSELLEKNPKSFDKKFKKIKKQDLMLHARGCNCKKTGCMKKYCECYAGGLKCTNLCKCDGCENCGVKLEKNDINKVQEIVKRKRKRTKPFLHMFMEKIECMKTVHNNQ